MARFLFLLVLPMLVMMLFARAEAAVRSVNTAAQVDSELGDTMTSLKSINPLTFNTV